MPESFRTFEIAILGSRGVEKKEYRFFVPLAVQKKGYAPAFEGYLRKGWEGLGPNDKKALTEADGDFKKAVDYLREKGLAQAAKRSDRSASEGVVEVYSHGKGRVAVVVEVNCESDFVAATDDFKGLVHQLALHIAFSNPRYIRLEDVPADVVEAQRAAFRAEAAASGKPESVLDRIVQGKLDKFYDEVCLLRQPFVKDDTKTVRQILAEAAKQAAAQEQAAQEQQ